MVPASGLPQIGRVRYLSSRQRSGDHGTEARAHHRHHRSGRLVPGRTAARQRLRSLRTHPAAVGRKLLAHRSPARSAHADSWRSARPAVAHPRVRPREADGTLQPGGHVVRAGLMGTAAAHGRIQLAGRDPRARSHPRGQPRQSASIRRLRRRCTARCAKCRRWRPRRSIRAARTACPRCSRTTSR